MHDGQAFLCVNMCCTVYVYIHNQRKMSCTKKDVEMGLFVQCLYALSLHLVSVVFGTAIPTSLYIFGLLVLCIHSCKCVCVCLFIYSYLHISPTQCFISLNTLDFDECASENSNGCQQNCSNTEGSYTCSCNVGYTLDEDGYTCNGEICIIVLLLIILYLYVYDKCEDGVPCFVCVSIC